ncbi:hypothetical protein DXG01_016743 [Tephrocybe rancida]|nr:hypothetical protein DXG01_016743 [Tephrocybe rancida]
MATKPLEWGNPEGQGDTGEGLEFTNPAWQLQHHNFVYAHAVFIDKWPDNPGVALPQLAHKFIHGYAAGDAYTDEIVMLVEGPQAPHTHRVSSYAHNWWIENADPTAKLLSPVTVEACLNHHQEVQAAGDAAIAVIISDDESEAKHHDPAIRAIISDDLADDLDAATKVVIYNDKLSGKESDLASRVVVLEAGSGDEDVSAMSMFRSNGGFGEVPAIILLTSDACNSGDGANLSIITISDDEADERSEDQGMGINVLVSDEELSGDERECPCEATTTVGTLRFSHGKSNTGAGHQMGVKAKVPQQYMEIDNDEDNMPTRMLSSHWPRSLPRFLQRGAIPIDTCCLSHRKGKAVAGEKFGVMAKMPLCYVEIDDDEEDTIPTITTPHSHWPRLLLK